MTHSSLQGCTCSAGNGVGATLPKAKKCPRNAVARVSWKEYGRSQPAPRMERLCKTTAINSASNQNNARNSQIFNTSCEQPSQNSQLGLVTASKMLCNPSSAACGLFMVDYIPGSVTCRSWRSAEIFDSTNRVSGGITKQSSALSRHPFSAGTPRLRDPHRTKLKRNSAR
jgi:hypothetical protein